MGEFHHLHHQQEEEEEEESSLLVSSMEDLDSLYCEEEHWEEEEEEEIVRPDLLLMLGGGGGVEEEEEEEEEDYYSSGNSVVHQSFNYSNIFNNDELLDSNISSNNNINDIEESGSGTTSSTTLPSGWEHHDHELTLLFSKELQQERERRPLSEPVMRRESVEWILRVCAHYSFSVLTASLAVDYLDRFIYRFSFQSDKPWMTQLASVACLSLAAKMEETHVPLLLDLQVAETKYVFEAKTIQRMEILVLSTLEWRMSSVTPYSFLDYMVRRLAGLISWEFLPTCEKLLLALLPDCRFLNYPPSVVAAATMLHAIRSCCCLDSVQEDFQHHLFTILGRGGIDKDKVSDCGALITQLLSQAHIHFNTNNNRRSNKRKHVSTPGSPNGVIDVSFSSSSSDCSSNDSWTASSSSSVSSSPTTTNKRLRTTSSSHLHLHHQLWTAAADTTFSNHHRLPL